MYILAFCTGIAAGSNPIPEGCVRSTKMYEIYIHEHSLHDTRFLFCFTSIYLKQDKAQIAVVFCFLGLLALS